MNATFSLGGLAVFLLVSVFFALKNLAEELALRTDISVEQSTFLFHLYHHLTYIGVLALFIFPHVSICCRMELHDCNRFAGRQLSFD